MIACVHALIIIFVHSTYNSIIDHIDNGDLNEWGTKTPAPQIAIDYWRMAPDANLRDLFLNGAFSAPPPPYPASKLHAVISCPHLISLEQCHLTPCPPPLSRSEGRRGQPSGCQPHVCLAPAQRRGHSFF